MTDLIKRLEAATEGSRQLDFEIHWPDREVVTWWFNTGKIRFAGGDDGSSDDVSYYTTSIDAAMTLVPEGHTGSLAFGGGRAVCHILSPAPYPERVGYAVAPTPALAICLAAEGREAPEPFHLA